MTRPATLSARRRATARRPTYQYNADGELVDLTNLAPGGTTVNSSFAYTYNALGLVTSMTTGGTTTDYGYDADGELTSVTAPGESIQYAYDPSGNRTSVTDNGVVTPYTANSVNEYTTVGGTTYGYDADGNMTSSTTAGVTTTYTFNSQNQLTAVDSPAGHSPTPTTRSGTRSPPRQRDGDEQPDRRDRPGTILAQTGRQRRVARQLHLWPRAGQPGRSQRRVRHTTTSTSSARRSGITGAAGSLRQSVQLLPFGQTTTMSAAVANPFTFVGPLRRDQDDGAGLFDMRARILRREHGSVPI